MTVIIAVLMNAHGEKNILLIFYKIYYDKYITARINVTGQLNTHFIRASLVFIIFFFLQASSISSAFY